MKNIEEKFFFSLYGLLALSSAWGATLAILKYNLIGVVCPLVVFALPPAFFFLWILKKLRGIRFDDKFSGYVIGFHVVAIIGWGVSFLPGVFYGLIWFHILDPWPFSLQQGPDTIYSREGFKRVVGFIPESNFKGIFFKEYNIRDSDKYLRFTTDKMVGEDKIFATVKKTVTPCKAPDFHLNSRLSWWLSASQVSELEHWEGERKELWINRQSGTFFVRTWTY